VVVSVHPQIRVVRYLQWKVLATSLYGDVFSDKVPRRFAISGLDQKCGYMELPMYSSEKLMRCDILY
jgi:hypothetical protein